MDTLKELIDGGQHLAAIKRFEQLKATGDLGLRELATGYHLVSVAHYGTRDYHAAKAFAEKAAELAQEVEDTALQLRVWANAIEYYRIVGDLHMANQSAQRWQANAHCVSSEARKEGRIRYNLALVQRQIGGMKGTENAIREVTRAAELLVDDSVTYQLMALQMAAWMLYEAGDFPAGDMMVQRARQLLVVEDVAHLKREQLLLRAWRAYHQTDYWAAFELAQELIISPGSDQQQFWAAYMIAMSTANITVLDDDLAARLKTSATYFANLCVGLSIQLKEGRLMNAASQARRQVTNRWGNAAG